MNGEGAGSGDPSKVPEATADLAGKAKSAFDRGLIERGEAAVADASGNLPAGATHEIVGYDPDGNPILKRRRFAAAKLVP